MSSPFYFPESRIMRLYQVALHCALFPWVVSSFYNEPTVDRINTMNSSLNLGIVEDRGRPVFTFSSYHECAAINKTERSIRKVTPFSELERVLSKGSVQKKSIFSDDQSVFVYYFGTGTPEQTWKDNGYTSSTTSTTWNSSRSDVHTKTGLILRWFSCSRDDRDLISNRIKRSMMTRNITRVVASATSSGLVPGSCLIAAVDIGSNRYSGTAEKINMGNCTSLKTDPSKKVHFFALLELFPSQFDEGSTKDDVLDRLSNNQTKKRHIGNASIISECAPTNSSNGNCAGIQKRGFHTDQDFDTAKYGRESLDFERITGNSDFPRSLDTDGDISYPVFHQPPYSTYLENLEEAKWVDDLTWTDLMIDEDMVRTPSDSTLFEDPQDLAWQWDDPESIIALEKAYNIVFLDAETENIANGSEDNKASLVEVIGHSDMKDFSTSYRINGSRKIQNSAMDTASQSGPVAFMESNDQGMKFSESSDVSGLLSDFNKTDPENLNEKNGTQVQNEEVPLTLSHMEYMEEVGTTQDINENFEARYPDSVEIQYAYGDDDEIPNLEPTDFEGETTFESPSSKTLVRFSTAFSEESTIPIYGKSCPGQSLSSLTVITLGPCLENDEHGEGCGTSSKDGPTRSQMLSSDASSLSVKSEDNLHFEEERFNEHLTMDFHTASKVSEGTHSCCSDSSTSPVRTAVRVESKNAISMKVNFGGKDMNLSNPDFSIESIASIDYARTHRLLEQKPQSDSNHHRVKSTQKASIEEKSCQFLADFRAPTSENKELSEVRPKLPKYKDIPHLEKSEVFCHHSFTLSSNTEYDCASATKSITQHITNFAGDAYIHKADARRVLLILGGILTHILLFV